MKLIEKKLKLLERKNNILLNNVHFKDTRDEGILVLKKLLSLEEEILKEKWGKLLEKEKELEEYIKTLQDKRDFITLLDDEITFK